MKPSSISLAKITRPILAGIFPRERLFRIIDRCRKRPIIWISGPPGSGKTTLVSSYLEARKLNNLWYRIDEGDDDVSMFFNYMNRAVKMAGQPKKSALPHFTSEYLSDIFTFIPQYFEDFYSRFKKGPSVIVFDNYQRVRAQSLFHKVINIGLSKIPEGIKVILISRSDMPPVLARMRANYLPEVISRNELRLTLEELEGIVRMRGLRKQPRETIKILHDKTNGWVAGLVLMLEKAKMENIETQLLNMLTPNEIFDYFTTEIFEKMDSRIQDFLLMTAMFPRMTSRMAERLTGNRKADRILTDLTRDNHFIEKYLQHEPVYQYQPLFREFLLSCAKDSFTQDDLSRVQRRAASILIEFDLIDDAAGLLCETCNWDELVKLIHKHAQSLLAQGRSQTLDGWLASLPEDIVENNSWIFYWKGLCRLPFSPGESLEYFEKAFHLFKSQQDMSGICLAWSGAVESIVYNSELTRLDQWISVLDKHNHVFKKEFEAHVASCVFIALVLSQPQHPEIDYWADRALSLSQKSGDISIKIQTLLYMAWHNMFKGDFAKAVFVLDSLREITQLKTLTPLDLLKIKDTEAFYYWLTAKHEQCRKTVSDGLELSSKTGVHIIDYFLLGHGAANALSMGDPAKSKRLLQKMASSPVILHVWEKSLYHFLVTWEALLQQDLTKALLYAELALKLACDAGVPQIKAICHIEKAHVMHEVREYKEADEHLELARNIGKIIKSRLIEFMCFLFDSQFAFDRGEETSGTVSLQKAMAIGRRQRYVNTFIWLAPVMAKLCAKAIEAGIEVEYVQDLVKKRGLIPDIPPLHIENWPWPLKIFTLGRFGLVKDGKPVRFSGKVQKKPLSMLKALITFGGREVNESQLIDALWYDADGDVAHKSFATTLHRLRKLIGNDKVIQLREGRVTLDHRYCWVDVWAFERILGQADAAWKEVMSEKDMAQIIRLSERAIEMYKGTFLAGETDQPWTISFRERLRSKFLRNVGKVGFYWEHVGDLNKAVNCYLKGLEVDDLAEEFYQRLMICYQRLGRRAEALATYNRCRHTLSAVLGVEPSRETEVIYKSLLTG